MRALPHKTRFSFFSVRTFVCAALVLGASYLSLSLAPAYAQSAVNSPASAIKQAMTLNGQAGKVLGVREKTRNDGSSYYEVKILTNGKVAIYKIPRQ